jgi:CheY-like chemotaxis protein
MIASIRYRPADRRKVRRGRRARESRSRVLLAIPGGAQDQPRPDTFPRKHVHLQVRRTSRLAEPGAAPSSAKSCQVLLVEDDPSVAELYATVLRLNGHVVTVAADGLAGLDALRSGNFDIVLLDIRMPHMDGLEMLRTAIGERGPTKAPVVILTNYDDPNLRQQALDLGARDYLLKSRTMPQALAAKVAELCG